MRGTGCALARSAAASQFGVPAGLRDAGVDPASYKMQCAGKQKDYTKCRVGPVHNDINGTLVLLIFCFKGFSRLIRRLAIVLVDFSRLKKFLVVPITTVYNHCVWACR